MTTYTERQYAKLEQWRKEKQEVKRRQREKRQKTHQELYRAIDTQRKGETNANQFRRKVEDRESAKTRPECLFYVSETKCDALKYMNCQNCKYYKPKKWGAKQEIERAIKDYEKRKADERKEMRN